MYEIVEVGGSKTESAVSVIKMVNQDESISWIPFDETNSDYQAYLLTVKE